MRPLLRTLSAALVVALSGCASGFDRLGPFELQIFQNGENDASLIFEYDRQKRGCQVLDEDFSVEMNGTPAIFAAPGDNSTPVLSGTDCFRPSAAVRRPDVFGQTATITATSGGDTLLLEIEGMGRSLGARPILAPREVVHAGQLVQIAVDPGFERLRWGDIAQFNVQPGWVSIAPPSAAGVFDVHLPSNMPPGPAHIAIGANTQPVVTRCEHAGPCDFSTDLRFGLEIDVVVEIAP